MAQLRSIIGSILRDIISAQHEANLYSISLSENYGKDGKAKDFQLPNVFLSDMELDLKYGVVGTEECNEEYNFKYSKLRSFIRELCSEAARTTITSVIYTILTTDIQRNEEDKQFFTRLKREDVLNREFRSFLVRNMRQAFNNSIHETIDRNTGFLLTGRVVERLMEVVRKKILDYTDLNILFGDTDGKALRAEVEQNVKRVLDELVRNKSKDISFRRNKTFPLLNVAVTADELANMSEDAIHSFKLKFSPTTCNITSLEDDEDIEDFVMK
ncbi:MAG: hypothetical protein IJE43_03695 [Alphaproteobacteria bacterium]|nr:hypothetical protein [Alphaproteobacteria bacterium]